MTSIPILTYHALGDSQSPIMTAPDAFAAQLDTLAAAGYQTATLRAAFHQADSPRTSRAVLTFDDAYTSVYEIAYPMLKARGMVATVYVISDLVGTDNRWRGQPEDAPTLPLMTWDQLAELVENGWEIGAHARTHPPLTKIDKVRLEDQIAGSQWAIQAKLGRAVRSFAYPYGAVNREVKDAVTRYYDLACGTRLGVAHTRSDHMALPRVDAYYLTNGVIKRMNWLNTRLGFHLLDGARRVRRAYKPDWDAKVEW